MGGFLPANADFDARYLARTAPVANAFRIKSTLAKMCASRHTRNLTKIKNVIKRFKTAG